MNLILLEQSDYLAPDRIRLNGRRFRHICEVLRAGPGDVLTVGALGGKIGRGTIDRLDATSLEMDIQLDRDAPTPLAVTVILALPRPKVMRRVLFSLAVLGVKKIFLVNAARVEKSFWQTPFLQPAEVRRQLLLGLEQGGDTLLPEVQLRTRFRPFVEDELPGLSSGGFKYVAHPPAVSECARALGQHVTLAVGPEGGFVPFEVDLLVSHGFAPIRIGDRVLNIETAIPSLISAVR